MKAARMVALLKRWGGVPVLHPVYPNYWVVGLDAFVWVTNHNSGHAQLVRRIGPDRRRHSVGSAFRWALTRSATRAWGDINHRLTVYVGPRYDRPDLDRFRVRVLDADCRHVYEGEDPAVLAMAQQVWEGEMPPSVFLDWMVEGGYVRPPLQGVGQR